MDAQEWHLEFGSAWERRRCSLGIGIGEFSGGGEETGRDRRIYLFFEAKEIDGVLQQSSELATWWAWAFFFFLSFFLI